LEKVAGGRDGERKDKERNKEIEKNDGE